MNNLKKITASALALVLSLGLVACNSKPGNSEGKVDTTTSSDNQEPAGKTEETAGKKLLVWGPAEDQAEASGNWLKKQAEEFNKEKGYDVKFEFGTVGEPDAKTEVLKDVSAAADVYLFANDQIRELVDGQALARLGGNFEEYVKTTNGETYASSVTVDDAIYAFPFTSNTWFMYYDKSVFSEEDVKSLDTMLEKGRVEFPLQNSWYIQAFFLANGGTMFGDSTDNEAGIDFGGEKGYEVAHYLIDLVANKNFFVTDQNGFGIGGLGSDIDAFFSGSWDAVAVKEKLGDNMGAAQLPTAKINGQDKQLISFAGTKAVGVNPNSKDQALAMEFAQWLARPEAQKAHFEARNVIPAHKDLLEDPTIQESEVAVAEMNTMLNTSFLQPFVAGMSQWWSPAENFGSQLASGEITHENVEQYVDEFNKQVNSSVLD